jgi:hypothetical protein
MTIFVHDDSLYAPWEWHPRFTYLVSERYGLKSRLVNFLQTPLSELAADVGHGDAVLGHWGHHPTDLARIQPAADRLATLFGGRVFPAPHTYLYYDDKARQASLFLNRGYPTPATAVVGSPAELESFVARESLSFPLVMKQAHGAGSSAVGLLHSPGEARFPCIVQQFCPGNTGDYRINVIGHRVMGFARRNRENDFRASGSGHLIYEDALDPALVALAARISAENGFESMAYDFTRLDGRWVVLEMSYCYVDTAVRDCPFYYDTSTGERVAKPGVYPQDFIVEDFLARHCSGVTHACRG